MLPFSSQSHAEEGDRIGAVLPKRLLGKTGEWVTMLGVGGFHVGWTSERDAQAVIEAALAGGVRFFDTAESYGPHTGEIRYGKYLTPGYRKEIFLMTKSQARDAETARAHLEGSLSRMKTDYLDLWQVHSVYDPQDVDNRVANGVFDVMMEAKESGLVKHIGFTGHQNPLSHLRVLEHTAERHIFETIQMPINVVDANLDHFIQKVLPVALDRNMGVLAMKTLADGRFFSEKIRIDKVQWNTDDPVVPGRISMQEALHFVWSLPVSVLITGAENEHMMKEKIALAKSFRALSAEERAKLVERVADLAIDGKVEYYKKLS